MSVLTKEQIIQELDHLTQEQQKQVLNFVRSLEGDVQGVPGEVLIAHMNDFQFAPGVLDEMLQVIEEECERIDWDEWK